MFKDWILKTGQLFSPPSNHQRIRISMIGEVSVHGFLDNVCQYIGVKVYEIYICIIIWN